MDLSTLNEPQREAVEHVSGPLLVLAGAGSGKTRVITYRIARLIQRGVLPNQIAALTFTNKAALEMRHRVADLLTNKEDAGLLTMGTFHSLGLQILKAERKAMGYPRGFVIYDTSDQLGVVREIMRRVSDTRRYDIKAILARISLAKNAFLDADDEFPVREGDEYDEITSVVYPKYQRALKGFAALDFDDLIYLPVKLLEDNAEVASRWASKFRYLMVDEYQDTNMAQVRFIRALIASHGNLCVVGDDDQSIYSWRGADSANILGFSKAFPGATVIKLEQNYRSTSTILNAANSVIENNNDRYGKTLWSDKGDGPGIISATAPDTESEAKFVAQEIITTVKEESRRYDSFAVLYRSNIQSKVIEEEFRQRDIPYVMFGGQQFFERKEVKDLIAYLRVALNPRDEISLRRIINYPSRGIGHRALEELMRAADSSRQSLWYAAENVMSNEGIRPNTKQSVHEFVTIVEDVGHSLKNGEPVVDVTRRLIDAIDLYGDLRAASPSLAVAKRRIDHVESLLRSLASHEERNPGQKSLADFLRNLALANENSDSDDSGNKVVMTTLHGSKGLEYPIVFLVGMEEELLPHIRTLQPSVTNAQDIDKATDLSEERRLAYVGITRAMVRLYLTRSEARVVRGKRVPRTPSRFLMEIPDELVEQRDIQAEACASVDMDEISAFFQALS